MYASGAEERALDVVPIGELVVPIGELVVAFSSIAQTDTLRNATTFRRHLGGSPTNIAVYVSRLGGTAALITKTGIGAFGKFLKSQLGRHGVLADYRIMDHRTNTTLVFVSSTSGTPNFEEFRGGDYLLSSAECSEEAVERACVDNSSAFDLSREPCRPALSEGSSVERVGVGPLPKARVKNVTGARDAFWSALLITRLEGEGWGECVRFAYEVATLKLLVEGHIGRIIDRETLYERLEPPAERQA